MTILEIFASATAGGTFIKLIEFFSRGVSPNEHIKTINMLRNDINRLNLKIDSNQEVIDQLKEKLCEKDKLVSLLEATSWDSPFPYWIKDIHGRVIYINRVYEEVFNILSIDYIGKIDEEVWDNEDYINKSKENHEKLINSNEEYLIDYESFEDWNLVIWKTMAGNVVIGISGMSIPKINNK
jgi:PAS domain-containing protein